MFLLRIAEALVTNQESIPHGSTIRRSDAEKLFKRTTSTDGNHLRFPITDSKASENSEANTSTASVKEHSQPSGSSEFSSPSLSATTNTSARTFSPGLSGSQPSLPPSNLVSVNGHTGQARLMHQGLLYNLLVNSENGGTQQSSPFQCYSPLLNSGSKFNSTIPTPMDMDHRSDTSGPSTSHQNNDCNGKASMTAITTTSSSSSSSSMEKDHRNGDCFKALCDGTDSHHAVNKESKHSNHAMPGRRANSFGSGQISRRSYLRQHASSVGLTSDSNSHVGGRFRFRQDRDGNSCTPPSTSFNLQSNSLCSTNSTEVAVSSAAPVPQANELPASSSSAAEGPLKHLATTESLNGYHLVTGIATLSNSFNQPLTAHQQLLTQPTLAIASRLNSLRDFLRFSSTTKPNEFSQALIGSEAQPILKNLIQSQSDQSTPVWVQLAKKIARPVQARVTEWLRQAAEFVALSTPVINAVHPGRTRHTRMANGNGYTLTGEHWLCLLAECWHRLLVLSMAENTLDVVVVTSKSAIPDWSSNSAEPEKVGLPWLLLPYLNSASPTASSSSAIAETKVPDSQFTTGLSDFLACIRQASLSSQEYNLLRHVILLTAHEPTAIPALALSVLQSLRAAANSELNEHSTRPNGHVNGNGHHTPEEPTSHSKSFTVNDLEMLFSGLQFLTTLCPYRTALLFCTHLQNGSTLTRSFLAELHIRYLAVSQQLANLSMIPAKTEPTQPDRQAKNDVSILEQLFDNS